MLGIFCNVLREVKENAFWLQKCIIEDFMSSLVAKLHQILDLQY